MITIRTSVLEYATYREDYDVFVTAARDEGFATEIDQPMSAAVLAIRRSNSASGSGTP